MQAATRRRMFGCAGVDDIVSISLLNSLVRLLMSRLWVQASLMATSWPRREPQNTLQEMHTTQSQPRSPMIYIYISLHVRVWGSHYFCCMLDAVRLVSFVPEARM